MLYKFFNHMAEVRNDNFICNAHHLLAKNAIIGTTNMQWVGFGDIWGIVLMYLRLTNMISLLFVSKSLNEFFIKNKRFQKHLKLSKGINHCDLFMVLLSIY